MAATYTHRNSLMTSDRPENLPEGQDTETLTRALEMGAWSCLPMCYTFLSAPILNTNVYPQCEKMTNKPTVHCYTKKQALIQNIFNPKVWIIKRLVTKGRQRKNTRVILKTEDKPEEPWGTHQQHREPVTQTWLTRTDKPTKSEETKQA